MEKSYRYVAWFALFLFLIEITGFYNSYFSKFPLFTGWMSLHHLHFLSMFLWFAMLFIQPILIYRGNIKAHRLVGKFSYILIPVITILSLRVMKFSYTKAVTAGIPVNAALGFLWVSFSALIPFLIIYALAIFYRGQTGYHMRYMIGTAVALLGPAVGRINFGVTDLNAAIVFAFAISDVFFVFLLIFEYFKGKNYRPHLVSLIICLTFHVVFPWVSNSPVWHSIAGAFVRL